VKIYEPQPKTDRDNQGLIDFLGFYIISYFSTFTTFIVS